MKDYPTVHLDTKSSKGAAFSLLFCISQSQYGLQQRAQLIP